MDTAFSYNKVIHFVAVCPCLFFLQATRLICPKLQKQFYEKRAEVNNNALKITKICESLIEKSKTDTESHPNNNVSIPS